MKKKPTSTARLDEILVQEGLVTEEQIKEALMRQKAFGGKIGSQLLYHRFIDEASLVKALTRQFGSEGVVLSNLQIPKEVIEMIPRKIAVSRRIIPFDYDANNKVLKIACEDPSNEGLVKELKFIVKKKKIKLYVAAELSINTAIAKHYLGKDITLDDNLLLEIPDETTETGGIRVPDVAEPEPDVLLSRGAILLVTDEEFSAPLLQSILERDNFQVTVTDSADDAIDIIGDKQFHTVFIKDTVPGDYIDLIDRLRKSSPRTVVRYYETSASLLLNSDTILAEGEMLIKNLDLFTALLSSIRKLATNHSGTVGYYVNKLCKQLGLPDKERLTITNAGYLHDLSKFYYSSEHDRDPRKTIKLTIKLLESLNYSPIVVEMLRSMYINLGGKYTKRLPIEVLGGNILTIIDLFCDNVPVGERLSLEKFEAIKKKFRDLAGKLFLREVVEACIVMVQEEILTQHTTDATCQVMMYSRDTCISYPLELRIKSEGFRTMGQGVADTFIELYLRSKPDIVLLLLPGEPDDVISTIEDLEIRGVNYSETPTFLLVESSAATQLTGLLEKGIEDILSIDANPDLLIAKMQKIQAALEENRGSSSNHKSGTTGRLSDMNLIDLLQALGPSRKSVKIVISPNIEDACELTLYLNRGAIIYAACGSNTGADAVYEAIGWTDGTWIVEPVQPDEFPEPNNELSNESILMEGCRLLDERVRSGQL